jgi:hypothetical protein
VLVRGGDIDLRRRQGGVCQSLWTVTAKAGG